MEPIKIQPLYTDCLRQSGGDHVAASIMQVADQFFLNLPKTNEALFDIASALREIAYEMQKRRQIDEL